MHRSTQIPLDQYNDLLCLQNNRKIGILRLADSKLDLNITQKKLDDIDNYDDQILKLKSEVRVLTREKTDLLIR